jgi:hypothetical protein
MNTKKNCLKNYRFRTLSRLSKFRVLKDKNYFPPDPNSPGIYEPYHSASRGDLIWPKKAKRKIKYVSKCLEGDGPTGDQ